MQYSFDSDYDLESVFNKRLDHGFHEDKDYRRGTGADYYNARLFDPSYVGRLGGGKISRQAEPVYKVISSGAGTKSLSNLMQYLMRDKPDQIEKGQEKMVIYDDRGNEITGEKMDEILQEWEQSFEASRPNNDNPGYYDRITYFQELKSSLEVKFFENDYTDEDGQKYMALDMGFLPDDIWSAGTVVQHDNLKETIREVEKDRGKIYLQDHTESVSMESVEPIATGKGFPIMRSSEDLDLSFRATDDERFYIEGFSKGELKRYAPKDFQHFILSPGGDGPDKQDSFAATKEHLDTNLKARGFRYMMCMHDDTKNLHFHVIAQHHNELVKDLTFPTNFNSSFAFRKEYADSLERHGIDRDVTLRKDRPKDILREKVDRVSTAAERHKDMHEEDKGAYNPLVNLHTFLSYTEELEDEIDEKFADSVSQDQRQKAKKTIREQRKNINLFNDEKFDETVEGVGKWLSFQSDKIAEFWKDEMQYDKLMQYDEVAQERKDDKRIQAQEKQLERFETSFQQLLRMEKRYKDHDKLDDIDALKKQHRELIQQGDNVLSYVKGTQPKYRTPEAIDRELGRPIREESREKTRYRSKD